ncbi:MAG TPA: enoyl-CoA hydratase/isomerase family protein [Streptosporangiaceae bacterium]|nr:enoyl-CoA hydratase/isomerase family protein [Streptosporangiaceae bacterium]
MTVQVSAPADGVRMITLARPEALNALTRTMVTELATALDEAERDEHCRTVILTGAGRAFCAGLDLRGFGDEDELQARGAARGTFLRQRDIAGLAERLHYLRQPVIAAVNGPAAGGGLALVLACDVVSRCRPRSSRCRSSGPATRRATSARRGYCRASSAPAGPTS